jgi:cytidylate kinase
VVRKALLGIQRRLAQGGGVIFEGRDMGTVVFPGADLKFFLYADPEIRAWRRYKELLAKGQTIDLDEVATSMKQRDRDDSNRVLAPLKPADDAISIDSSPLEEDEVVEVVLSHIGKLPK